MHEVHIWLRALLQIVLGMFPVSNYDDLQETFTRLRCIWDLSWGDLDRMSLRY